MSESRFSTELFAHLDLARDGIDGVSSELTSSEAFPRMLVDWFCILWDVIRATSPVLRHCVRRLEQMPPDEPLTRLLSDFYRLKLDEEHDHDQMLAGDLERLGVSRDQLMKRLPPAAITAMVGSQYYYIDYVHPAAYLGYVALLEAYPAKVDQLDNLIAHSGAPAEAWSTYRMHAEVDTWHREELAEILDQIPAEPFIRQAIVSNGLRSAEYYCQALETVLSRGTSAAAS